MANKNFVVQYLIRAKNSFSREAKAAAESFGKIDKESRKASKSLKKFNAQAKKSAKGFKGVSQSFASGFQNMAGAALAFFSIRGFIDKGAEFQDSLADLSSITGATGKELAFLRGESLRLGKASVTSQAQVATAFKLIASAKSELLEDPKGLSRVAEQVLLLANASGIELEQAALTTTQALNQFSAGAEQASRFVNVLAAGSKIGASEIAETGVAIIKSGAVAKQVGVSFEELNAAIQVLAKGGVKAEVAGTGLKTALLKLEKTGIANLSPSVVGLGEAFQNLSDMNLSVTQSQKIFGDEAVVIGSILANNAGTLKDWTRSLAGTNVAQEQATVKLATFRKQAQKVGIIFDGAVIRAFLRLEPVLTKNAKLLGEFFDGIKPENIDAFAESIGILIGGLKFVGFLLKEFLGLLKGIGTIIGQVGAALATFNLSSFDLKDAFRIGSPELGGAIKANNLSESRSRVDVGVNVGLDKGLKETTPRATSVRRQRRANVGMAAAGA